MMKLNNCYYSPGDDGHSCCTHQHYCIFNKKRWNLEKKITELTNELNKLKRLKNSYILGHYVGDVKYEDIIKKLDIVNSDISRLVKFKNRVLNKEVDGYGYEILESS